MGHTLKIKGKDGKVQSVEIQNNEGVTKAVKVLQEKVEALQHKTMRSSLNAKLPHNIGEKVYSSIPLDVYGYIQFDGRKIYSYDEFGDFYYYLKDIYNLLNSERYIYQLEKNYDVVGVDTKDDYGKISNFAHNSRYAKSKGVIKFSDKNVWRIEFYIKMGTEVLSNKIYHILGRENSTYSNGVLLRVDQSKFTMWHRNLSGTYVKVEGKTVLAPNTEYLVRVTYNNGRLSLSTKVINVQGAIDQYFKEFEVDSQNYPDSYIRFGDDYNSDAIMNGTIDLNRMKFYDLSNEDLSDMDIFFDSAPVFYRPSEMFETYTKEGFVPETVYEKELEKFGQSSKYVLNEEEEYVRIPYHNPRTLITRTTVDYPYPADIFVYSDGWCEQHIRRGSWGDNPNIAFVLPIPFKDTNYYVKAECMGGSKDQYTGQNAIIKTDRKQFSVNVCTNDRSGMMIDACGYVDLDEVPEEWKNIEQDHFEYLVVANGIDNVSVDRNDALTVNDPYVLLESRYTDLKMNNISWLRYEGETLDKETYPSAYKKLLEYRTQYNDYMNFVNREDPDDYSNEVQKPEIVVKLSTEEHTDDDYVINQEEETFTLPKKNVQSFIKSLAKNSIVLHSEDNLKIYSDGTCTYTTVISENGTINYPYPLTSVVITTNSGTITEKTSTSCTFTDVEAELTVTITGKVSNEVLQTFMVYNENEFYLYYYMGNTAQNLSLVNIAKLVEDVNDTKAELKEKANILEEVKGHTTKFSKTIAKTQVSKAINELISKIKLKDVYDINMNENFLLPDPTHEGSRISFKGYNFSIYADSFMIFDEYNRRLFLLEIRRSEHYSELVDENGDYNLSYDVYFTFDKKKVNKNNVINNWSGDIDNLPDYDAKARLLIKVYGENTINKINTPDGGTNVYSGYAVKTSEVNSDRGHLVSIPYVNFNKLSRNPNEVAFSNIRNRHISEIPKLLRGEGVDSLPLGEMELNFAGLRVQKVSGNFRNAPYGYYMTIYNIARWDTTAPEFNAHQWDYRDPLNLWGSREGQEANPSCKRIAVTKDNKVLGPMLSEYVASYSWFINRYGPSRDQPFYHEYLSWRYAEPSYVYAISTGDGTYGTSWDEIPCADGILSSRGVNNKVFAQRMSEFSMTVQNRYGSKTIVYDKTNVNQAKNNPCVFDFTEELIVNDRDYSDFASKRQQEEYFDSLDSKFETLKTNTNTNINNTLSAKVTEVNNKIAEMDGKYNTFTSDANTTIVQYENEMDKRYENSIGAVDKREAEHYTTLTNNLNAEISRAKSAESTETTRAKSAETTLQNNIDTLTTNTANNLASAKNTINSRIDGYSRVVVVDHIDKCTEDNIIYLVDPTWNNDYNVQTYEDVEIKNLTHD